VVGAEHIYVDDSLTNEEAVSLLKTRLDDAYARALALTAKA
jgi:hypothetical protein